MGCRVCIGSMTEETNIRSGWPKRPAGRARLAIVALTCSGAALIAGCSSSSTSNASGAHKAAAPVASQSPSGAASAPGMPKAAVCVHINALRTSLTNLTHIKVTATTASQLTTDLGNIQSHLTAIPPPTEQAMNLLQEAGKGKRFEQVVLVGPPRDPERNAALVRQEQHEARAGCSTRSLESDHNRVAHHGAVGSIRRSVPDKIPPNRTA